MATPASNKNELRLGGGPYLPKIHHDWWTAEEKRVAELEGLSQCSLRTLLIRIAEADLDLSLIGIAQYQYRKKKKENT